MALSDAKVKVAKVPKGKTQCKLADSEGMYLLVTLTGKHWKLKYRLAGKERSLSLGSYPDVTLKQARIKKDAAKKLLDDGIDPNQAKKADALKKKQARATTFEGVAREWLEKKSPAWAKATYERNKTRLEKHIFPWIGSLPIRDIEPIDVLGLARRIEKKGYNELAHRIKRLCGQVFRYGVACQYVKSDPTRDLADALAPVVVKHHACLTDPKEVGALMRAIQGYTGTHTVACALQLSPYVFLRPKELRTLEWAYIDFDKKHIHIPADKMKKRVQHIVPLSKQCIAILKDIQQLNGQGKYVFPSIRTAARPMSENTINVCLQKLGYDTSKEQCAHGFRGMASTLLHEQGYDTDVIERQLSHKEGNAVKAAYNHARHLPQRKAMMQAWADYLDGLRSGADVIPIKRHG